MRKDVFIILWGLGMATMFATAGIKSVDLAHAEQQETETHNNEEIAAQMWLRQNKISVPDSILWECEAAGAAFNVCPELLEALAWKESRYQETAKNGNCIGIMQMNKAVHADRLSWYGNDPYDVHAQIWAAASLLKDLSEDMSVEGEPADAGAIIAAYHGENNPQKEKLSTYTDVVLTVAEKLERAHGK